MKVFRALFNAGLVVALAALLIALVGLVFPELRPPVGARELVAYDALVVVLMLALGVSARKVPTEERAELSSWLYTAGFLHTLIALAIAVVNVGSVVAVADALNRSAIGQVVAPMGAALLPHAIGVWFGQHYEKYSSVTSAEASFIRALAEDATRARSAIAGLYEQRERALRSEVQALERQTKLWDQLHTSANQTLRDAEASLGALSTAAKRVADSTQGASDDMRRQLEKLGVEVSHVAANVRKVREELGASADEAGALSSALKQATGVLNDLERLQTSIVELLSRELFKR